MFSLSKIGLSCNYAESQWAFANFTVLPECACICAFNSKNSVIGECNYLAQYFRLYTLIYMTLFELWQQSASTVHFTSTFSTRMAAVIATRSTYFWTISWTKIVDRVCERNFHGRRTIIQISTTFVCLIFFYVP